MSRIYDNWERLVSAVLKKEQLWQLFHAYSRTPSFCSDASDFSSSFDLRSPPDEIEDCFVGKVNDLNQLIVYLIDDDKQHRIISIRGMTGIGKTTIAKKIYNHFKIKGSFKSFAWVCITQECKIRSVLEDVVKQLDPLQRAADIVNLSNSELVQLLCEVQKAKRCLIVLDDLWKMDHWNILKQAFLVVGLKNKILLTTRNQDVAAVGFVYELGLLKADDGWELLENKSFLQNNITDADKRQHESDSVRNWIAEVRDLAYRAEDVVETYALEISSRKGKCFIKLLKRFSCALFEGFTLHQIDSEISNIRSEIDLIFKIIQ